MLNAKQILELLSIIEKNGTIFIAQNLGPDYLTDTETERLKRMGIDPAKTYLPQKDFILQQFYLGLVSDAMGENVHKVSYGDIEKNLKAGNYIPTTFREKSTIESIRKQFLGDIRGINGKVFADVNGIISESDVKNRKAYEDVIRNEVERGQLAKKTNRQIASDIHHKTGDWSRNFSNIVEYIGHQAFDSGRAALYEKQDGDEAMVFKDVYPGACFPTKDTEFLTNEGFKLLDDIRGDEKVLSFNKETNNSKWVKVKNKIRYDYEGKMHQYKHNSLNLLSTPNHKHLVRIETQDNNKTHYTNILTESYNLRDIPKRSFFYQTIENYKGKDVEEIFVCGRKFKTEWFVKFMGIWLSEGHIVIPEYKLHKMVQLHITQLKEHNFEYIENVFNNAFPDRNINRSNSTFYCTLQKRDMDLAKWFKEFGKCYDKYVPSIILNLSKRYLQMFLDAYIVGDGCIGKPYLDKDNYLIKGKTSIVTTSKNMADGLSEVILKLGKGVSVHKRDVTGNISYKKDGSKVISRRPRYDLNITTRVRTRNINLYFKEIEDWKGEVGCLELYENNTLLIRRDGYVCWSGNCKYCIKLYLTGGVGSKPIIFKLDELRNNGTNIGRKVADLQPVVGSTHVNCRCTINRFEKGMVWDEEKGRFTRGKKVKIVGRKPVKMTFNNKEYNV